MRRTTITLALAAVALTAFAGTARAQSYGPGPSENAFQVRLGGFFLDGGGQVWDDNEDIFTLDTSDFNDGILGLSFVKSVNNNFEIGFNADFYDSTVRSAYRDYTDQDGFSILHDTRLAFVPLTVDVRFLPVGRYRMRPQGRRVQKPVVYIGAGLGVVPWKYEETGDFVDFSDIALPVFSDRFVDDGTAFETHVVGGVELPLTPTVNLLFEGRHSWIDDNIDLGRLTMDGTSVYVGAAFRF